jgi:2'-5' RNA ligase
VIGQPVVLPAMAGTNFFIWLCPEHTCAAYLQKIIDGLCRAFEAPGFAPHLTLGGGIVKDLTGIEALLGEIAERHPPLTLRITRLATSPQRLKALHLTFEPAVALDRLQSDVRQNLPGLSAKAFEPHLSLLYKTLTMAQRRELEATFAISLSRISFDSVRLITAGATSDERTAVSGWRCASVKYLRPVS